MEKDRGSSKPEDPFEIDWSAHKGAEESETAEPPESGTVGQTELPVEPPLPWETEAEDYNAQETLAEFLRFHLHGKREPHSVPDAESGRPLPALLYAHRDLTSVRYEYPVCLTRKPEVAVKSLTGIVDGLISAVVEEGDVGERRRRHILQLETVIRESLDAESTPLLAEAWDQAAARLLEEAPSEEKRELLEQSLSAARAELKTDGELLTCTPDTPRRIFLAAATAGWEAKCAEWRDDLDALVLRAENVLEADDSHTADVSSPEHLRDATAGGDMDFDKLSDLLRQSSLGEPLPESRRSRIQHSLDTIAKVKPLFDGRVSLFDVDTRLPFDVRPVHNASGAARDRYRTRMETMIEFFKSLQIVELEVENRYREDVHDRFFAQYDARNLTDEEVALCPPTILILDDDFFVSPDIGGLMEILGSGAAVKVFAEIRDLDGVGNRDVSGVPGWRVRLAAMTMALGEVYVSQIPASAPHQIHDNSKSALAYRGAAMISVFTGGSDDLAGVPGYLKAASAAESRMFPSFRFDPAAGDTLAERMSVSHNTRCDDAWPSEAFAYTSYDGKPRSVDLSFTPAEFMFLDLRFSAHFWVVTPDRWHERMVPLHEYLALDAAGAENRVPYLLLVDEDGQVARAVVTTEVVRMVRRVAAAWKGLQETGGINNSHALNLLAAEKAGLEAELKQRIAEIEKKYAANLDRDIGVLTQEIVWRIAAGLLSEGAMPAMGASAAAPAPAPAAVPGAPAPETPAEASPEPAVEEVEEDDAVESFDDPYIDTPLCTSCNDCTDINAKLFGYDANKQAFIADPDAGTFKDLVMAAEKCPVHIIHPGKPRNPSEPGLEDLTKRAEPFN